MSAQVTPEILAPLREKSPEELAQLIAGVVETQLDNDTWLSNILGRALAVLDGDEPPKMLRVGKILALDSNTEVRKVAIYRLEPQLETSDEAVRLVFDLLEDPDVSVAHWYADKVTEYIKRTPRSFDTTIELVPRISKAQKRQYITS